ncbi:hypothetical protein D3C79_629440 [compost metagenome]
MILIVAKSRKDADQWAKENDLPRSHYRVATSVAGVKGVHKDRTIAYMVYFIPAIEVELNKRGITVLWPKKT